MQKNPFYAENSSMEKINYFTQKILLCRKFFYVENSSMQKINYFMQKILLWRKFFYAENFFYAEK